MPVFDSIPAWLSARPYGMPAACATDSSASTCAADSASESTPASPSCSSFPATSPPGHSASSTSSPSVAPSLGGGPSVASAFPDCEALADTFLAKIAAGTECLAAIAAFHNIPYPRFTLWLLQPSTQERLAALSVAIASAARLTATAALPDIVRGLKTSVAQLQSQNHMTIAPPGANHLVAESIILRRHRALIAAASLIYRISRFTCPVPNSRPPQHEPPPRTRTHTPTARDSSAPPRRGRAPLPKLDLPTVSKFADLDPRLAAAQPRMRSRSPGPDGGAVERSETEGVTAVLTDSPRLSSSTSDIPLPTSDIDAALQILTAEYDLTPEEVAELRADAHSWIRDFIPPPAATKRTTPRARPTADDG